ncbi:MAG: fibronectin type III domain-containing protein [Chloroflexi bacterium]|nr:fibronectin type III domain-containing protein [Chloroflexota bacterium]MCY3581137.1 fibronectin type III domain-containing protein [Chloroflexota bacterium]MCY3715586.1 fibronectin type III domain-containing protein [Chloroflexota bacterium]MDE2650676.1 fibronectin type III domain-containing protein [Chloroflexota bacterium]MXX49906.1 fibronectin type III domain-containing protein [Chloroflexota bacterium]
MDKIGLHPAEGYTVTVTWHPGPNSTYPKKSLSARYEPPRTNKPTATPTSTLTPTPTATPKAQQEPQQAEEPQLPTDGSLGMIFPKKSKDHITVEWNDLNGVSLYMLDIFTSSYNDFAIYYANETSQTSHDFGGLRADTAYFFQFIALLQDGSSVTEHGQARTAS